jgi:hypothetical protein
LWCEWFSEYKQNQQNLQKAEVSKSQKSFSHKVESKPDTIARMDKTRKIGKQQKTKRSSKKIACVAIPTSDMQ